MKLFGKLLAKLGMDSLKQGTVIGKKRDSAQPVSGPIVSLPGADTCYLRVNGNDGFGNVLSEWLVVDEMTYNNTQVGDKWPTK